MCWAGSGVRTAQSSPHTFLWPTQQCPASTQWPQPQQCIDRPSFSGGKLCTHNHSMKEACFRWVMSTFTLLSLILSKPQPNLNTTVGFDNKMTLQTPPTYPTPPTTQTQHQQYISCYWPDFDETLKVGSCEHLEQIPTVTFVQSTYVLATITHIRNISAVTDPILMEL